MKYGLNGKLKATAGNGSQLAAILLKAADLMSTAKGCHLYIVGLDHQNADIVCITELWDSKETHDQSLFITGVRELIAQAMPLMDGRPEKGVEIDILGGFGA